MHYHARFHVSSTPFLYFKYYIREQNTTTTQNRLRLCVAEVISFTSTIHHGVYTCPLVLLVMWGDLSTPSSTRTSITGEFYCTLVVQLVQLYVLFFSLLVKKGGEAQKGARTTRREIATYAQQTAHHKGTCLSGTRKIAATALLSVYEYKNHLVSYISPTTHTTTPVLLMVRFRRHKWALCVMRSTLHPSANQRGIMHSRGTWRLPQSLLSFHKKQKKIFICEKCLFDKCVHILKKNVYCSLIFKVVSTCRSSDYHHQICISSSAFSSSRNTKNPTTIVKYFFISFFLLSKHIKKQHADAVHFVVSPNTIFKIRPILWFPYTYASLGTRQCISCSSRNVSSDSSCLYVDVYTWYPIIPMQQTRI